MITKRLEVRQRDGVSQARAVEWLVQIHHGGE